MSVLGEKTIAFNLWKNLEENPVEIEYYLPIRKSSDAAVIIFPNGPHGLGRVVNNLQVSKWTDLLQTWIMCKFKQSKTILYNLEYVHSYRFGKKMDAIIFCG